MAVAQHFTQILCGSLVRAAELEHEDVKLKLAVLPGAVAL
jgi:hypothetical protein